MTAKVASRVKLKHWLNLSLRLIFVGALLYYLAGKGFLSLGDTVHALSRLQYTIPALLTSFISLSLSVFRWRALLKTQSIVISVKKAFQLGLIGNFFNLALPGAVSGDVVKAYYVGDIAPGKRPIALSSILMDRIVGVAALIMVSLIGLILIHGTEISHIFPRSIKMIVIFLGVATLLGFSYLLLVKEANDPVLRILKRLEDLHVRFRSITMVYLGVRQYHHDRSTLLAMFFLSIFVHLCSLTSAVLFSLALQIDGIPFLGLSVAVPLGMLVTAVPVLPGGVGTGHAAFLALFRFLGSERGADVFSLFFLIQVIFGAIGGLVYLRYKAESRVGIDDLAHENPA